MKVTVFALRIYGQRERGGSRGRYNRVKATALFHGGPRSGTLTRGGGGGRWGGREGGSSQEEVPRSQRQTHEESLGQVWVERKGEDGVSQGGGARAHQEAETLVSWCGRSQVSWCGRS